MIKNIKKVLGLFLLLILTLSIFAGCGSKKADVSATATEIKIMEDSYERNDEITNVMTYVVDYISNPKSASGDVEIVNLYDFMKVQVDDWDCVTVGKSTIKEIIDIIDRSNENYVTSNTNAVIAERQAVIDEEYEKAKADAEANGKEYTKEKKKVRTDDIVFENPYEYTITLGKGSSAVTNKYEPTLLIDSSKNNVIFLNVSKYGIPYVTLACYRVSGIYNNGIIQESDWVMNSIQAADVSSYVDKKTGNRKNFVDVDGLNKAAKQNMFMSGNIAFGGGFTWESLMMFCGALNLTQGNSYSVGEGFEQSSDKNFTYYTITLNCNPFTDNQNMIEVSKKVPTTRLIATFDPLTHVCINWTIDTYKYSRSYASGKYHNTSNVVSVDVHEYQVDTNDYDGMRNTIKTWIENNSIQTTTKYAVINTGSDKVDGIVETGPTNLFIEPIINGVAYSYLGGFVDGYEEFADYITKEDLAVAESLPTQKETDDYIAEHKITWRVVCGVFKGNNLIGEFVFDRPMLVSNKEEYYVAYYEQVDDGYQNVRVITKDMINQLIMVYSNTYKLTNAQSEELVHIANNNGLMAVADYVNELFAEAEMQQAENNVNE